MKRSPSQLESHELIGSLLRMRCTSDMFPMRYPDDWRDAGSERVRLAAGDVVIVLEAKISGWARGRNDLELTVLSPRVGICSNGFPLPQNVDRALELVAETEAEEAETDSDSSVQPAVGKV